MNYTKLASVAFGAALVLTGWGCSGSATTPLAPTAARVREPVFTAVTFNPNGVTPKEITLRSGDGIEFRNSDLKDHWPASTPHPIHTDYPEFNPNKPIKPGETWRFVFTKTGTWKFHDHKGLDPRFAGKVIVTAE